MKKCFTPIIFCRNDRESETDGTENIFKCGGVFYDSISGRPDNCLTSSIILRKTG